MPSTKKYTLASRTSQHTNQRLQESVFFSTEKRTLSFFTNLFSPPHGFTANTNCCESNVNRFGQNVCILDTSTLRTDKRASGNSGFKKLPVQFYNQVQFPNQTFVLVHSFVLRNRQLLKPTKRCLQL